MPQGAAGSSAWFVTVIRFVTTGVDNTHTYLGDAIGSDDFQFLEPRIGAARVDLLGHPISEDGLRPKDDRVATLSRRSTIHFPPDICDHELDLRDQLM